jgi:hypothetical protein
VIDAVSRLIETVLIYYDTLFIVFDKIIAIVLSYSTHKGRRSKRAWCWRLGRLASTYYNYHHKRVLQNMTPHLQLSNASMHAGASGSDHTCVNVHFRRLNQILPNPNNPKALDRFRLNRLTTPQILILTKTRPRIHSTTIHQPTFLSVHIPITLLGEKCTEWRQ